MSKKSRKQQPASDPLCSQYLEHVKMTSFGRFANVIVGPFGPGLNVVLGPNEAGKTTLNELIKGVLFGWPSARGSANPYRPENAERVGSLFFKDTKTGDVAELKRTKNTDEVEAPAPLLSDIDRETYETMFALTSDELLGLDRHSDITARLLTAGSGTSASPAHALDVINTRIKETMSRSAAVPGSLANLRDEQAQVRQQIREGRAEAGHFREQEKTLESLRPRRDTLSQTQERLNEEIEKLHSASARLASCDKEIAETTHALEENRSAYDKSLEADAQPPSEDIRELVGLSQSEEYRLRDTLDELEERRQKLEHAVDNARRDANKSRADYEVLMEDAQAQEQHARARAARKAQLALAILIPLGMIAIGAYFIYRARALGGLSYVVPGAVLILFSLIIAAAGISMSLRPTRVEEELADERKKKEWVMQQDQKNVEACEQDVADHDARIATFMNANGMAAAQGSIRRARRLLDSAREYVSHRETRDQGERALTVQRSALSEKLEQLQRQRRSACLQVNVGEDATVADIEEIIARKSDERSKTMRLAQETDRQIGEITQQLAAARHLTSFDEVKLNGEVIETRLEEGYRQLAALLIAQRSLQDAIAEWEKKSQPEVYAHASRLFSTMTNGAWQTVRMNAQGDIEVVDSVKTVRSPQLLSLGTRQQLYLSLRIALLLTADNVGRGLPILCDDILVNFDDERRRAAAAALAELAKRRQVILFTCHPDVATLVASADSRSNLLEL